MRRQDREIKDLNEILAIVKKCDVCNVAFVNGEVPYVVPMNFGVNFNDGKFELFFHGANAGTKLELLKKNHYVAFSMDCSHKLILDEQACHCTMEYESVCGNGIMEIVKDDQKIAALSSLMEQYQGKANHQFNEAMVNSIAVMKLSVNEITGKRLKRN